MTSQAGAACIELTSPLLELSGFSARSGVATGVRDPLSVRALALGDGANRALVIVADVLGFEAGFVEVARRVVEAQTGIPAAHIMLCATHTHTAPTSMYLRRCGEMDTGWIATLLDAITAAAREAAAALTPARFCAGSVAVEGVSINRRRLGDAVDYDLDLLRIDNEQGNLAAFAAFGCHAIAAGPQRLISSDFPGVFRREVEARIGGIALWANGASADINPLMPGDTRQWAQGSFERVEAIGERLAGAALEAWPGLAPVETTPLSIRHRALELPLQEPPGEDEMARFCEAQLAAAGQGIMNGESAAYRNAAGRLDWAMQLKDARGGGGAARHVAIDLQVIRCGEFAFIGIPAETFAALGLAIKQAVKCRPVFVLGTTNGNIGYLASRGAYDEPMYELGAAYYYYGYPAALAPEAGELVVEAAIQMLEQS